MIGFQIGEAIGFALALSFCIWLVYIANKKITQVLESYWSKRTENKK